MAETAAAIDTLPGMLHMAVGAEKSDLMICSMTLTHG
jgi:hypothetical protein